MFEKLIEKLKNMSQKKDALMEAATFAQADEHEHARSAIAKDTHKPEPKGPGKILVVGSEYTFSDKLMDYAAEMAKRMDREIVALNATESDLRFRFMASHRDKVRDDFTVHAEKNAEVFKNKADSKEVRFEHLVKFSNPDSAIEAICQELGGTTYVLMEPNFDNEEAGAPITDSDVPVFCINSNTVH